jgi:hypothetical protein
MEKYLEVVTIPNRDLHVCTGNITDTDLAKDLLAVLQKLMAERASNPIYALISSDSKS